jgi:O-succinylbenzoic acid--CoA ligase
VGAGPTGRRRALVGPRHRGDRLRPGQRRRRRRGAGLLNRLVVVEAHGRAGFVDDLRRAWDDGDAVLPLDPRLPGPAREAALTAARIDRPVEIGDALVVLTSGTTGEPKAAVLTHDALAASAHATSSRLGVDPATDRWLACLPLAHVGGLGVVTRAVLTGTPLTVVADVRDHPGDSPAPRCTLVSLVPAQLPRVDVTRFRTILLGGSAMPPALPPNAVPTYGMTESGGGVVYAGVPLDGVDVRVDDGGQLHLRAPMLLRAYRDGHDPKDAGGWYPTGDAGTWDPGARRVTVAGRMGDVIVTGGEKVWPTVVEARLAEHPAVREVLVFGRPDPTWGQRVVARVVPAHPGAPPSLDELRGWVKESLPPWAAPHELEPADTLPRTALGKLRRAP